MIEITKQNENFTLTETTDLYEIKGNVSRDAAGSLNLYFNINTLEGNYIGDCHYSVYAENNTVNFGVNCSEVNREQVTTYADAVIDSVLAHFKQAV